MFQVILTKRAEKDLKKIAKIYHTKIGKSIDLLASNPFLGEKMTGDFEGSYRIKIPPIRIVYVPDLENKIIQIKLIGQREGIYK